MIQRDDQVNNDLYFQSPQSQLYNSPTIGRSSNSRSPPPKHILVTVATVKSYLFSSPSPGTARSPSIGDRGVERGNKTLPEDKSPIHVGGRSPSPRCRERRCIRSGYDRAGDFRREQGSCSLSRGEPAIARLLLVRARRRVSPLDRVHGWGERHTSDSSRRASAERRTFHPSPQRDRSGRRSAGRRRRHPARREFSDRQRAAALRRDRGLTPYDRRRDGRGGTSARRNALGLSSRARACVHSRATRGSACSSRGHAPVRRCAATKHFAPLSWF